MTGTEIEAVRLPLSSVDQPGGSGAIHVAPIQSTTPYIQELRQVHGFYRLWSDDPDQALDRLDVIEGDPCVYGSLRYLGLAAAGTQWSVSSDEPQFARLAQMVESGMKKVTDFLHARVSLARAILRGLQLMYVDWQERYCRLAGDSVPRRWVLPTRLVETDKRRLRMFRVEGRRDIAYWGIWDPGVDGFVVLEDRHQRPDLPAGFAAQDFLWYWADVSERTALFGEGLGDQLSELVGIKQRVVQYRARLAERWSEPTFILKVDSGIGAITDAAIGEEFPLASKRADEFHDAIKKWRARHSLSLNKNDELNIVEHGSATAASHEDFLRWIDGQIKLAILLAGVADSDSEGVQIGNSGDAEERGNALDKNVGYHRVRMNESIDRGLIGQFIERNEATLREAGFAEMPQPGDLSFQSQDRRPADPDVLRARLETAQQYGLQVPESWLHDELGVPKPMPGEKVAAAQSAGGGMDAGPPGAPGAPAAPGAPPPPGPPAAPGSPGGLFSRTRAHVPRWRDAARQFGDDFADDSDSDSDSDDFADDSDGNNFADNSDGSWLLRRSR